MNLWNANKRLQRTCYQKAHVVRIDGLTLLPCVPAASSHKRSRGSILNIQHLKLCIIERPSSCVFGHIDTLRSSAPWFGRWSKKKSVTSSSSLVNPANEFYVNYEYTYKIYIYVIYIHHCLYIYVICIHVYVLYVHIYIYICILHICILYICIRVSIDM